MQTTPCPLLSPAFSQLIRCGVSSHVQIIFLGPARLVSVCVVCLVWGVWCVVCGELRWTYHQPSRKILVQHSHCVDRGQIRRSLAIMGYPGTSSGSEIPHEPPTSRSAVEKEVICQTRSSPDPMALRQGLASHFHEGRMRWLLAWVPASR